MIQLNRKQKGAFVSGEMDVKDLAREILESYPVTEIAESLAELLTKPTTTVEQKPIVLSDDDYQRVMAMFRQRGISADGVQIKRGRPRKNEGVITQD